MKSWLVLFDIENQLEEVAYLKRWTEKIDFIFLGYSIKQSNFSELIELLHQDKIAGIIFLIGNSTNYLSQTFKNDSEQIISHDFPIVCFNSNGWLGLDETNCSRFLWNVGALHMPFTDEDVNFTLKNIKSTARLNEKTGSFYFRRNFPFDDPLSG